MASDEEPIYCLCRLPYDETRFMIECDVCKDWFHGSCVGVQEHQAVDIEIYHCPNCTPKHGPLALKRRRNWHRHDYSEDGKNLSSAVQTGTVVFIKELKKRNFPSADEIPIKRLHGSQLTPAYFEEEGFDVPVLCEKKDGLGLTMPPPSFSINDVEQLVGAMREIDVIDVARQEDIKMIMREWTEYYNSPNREKILNVISLEFSNTRLTEHVVPPSVIRQVSWARNVWPEQLPEDSNLARPEVQKYCLMGVKDSFTDFHIDFGGTSVWYHVLRGEKVFYLVQPTQTNLMLYERWLSSSNQSEMFFGDQVDDCYRMVVKQGHTLFIPTGWIHAVLTPIDSLVFGGNFLHHYNIALQLQCYEIERQVKTPEKYLFPSYETMNWYAAKNILDIIKDYTEENKSPPEYLVSGAKALSVSLKAWTQRKDLTSKYVYARVGKQDAADYIQYGKLLKDLVKEVKKMDSLLPKSSPKKQDHKRKRGEKPAKAAKKVKGLDVLDQHTKETLKSAERERRENIYNFDDEEDQVPFSLKVRIPKAGAYVAGPDAKETKPDLLGLGRAGAVSADENKAPNERRIKEESSKRVKKGVKKKESDALDPVIAEENVVKEEVVKTEDGGSADGSPAKEVPQCLKFKLSNGKMVSTDRKSKSSKLKKELRRGGHASPAKAKKSLVTDQDSGQPSGEKSKPEAEKGKRKKSLSQESKSVEDQSKGKKESGREDKKKKKKEGSESKEKDSSAGDKVVKKKPTQEKEKAKSKDSKNKKKLLSGKKKKSEDSKEKKKKPGAEEKGKAGSSAKAGDPKATDRDSDEDQLVVDENPKKKRVQKTTSTTKPASLKLKLPPGAAHRNSQDGSGAADSGDDTALQSRLGLDTIRGGLNGSISDILTASGYGTETSFRVDNEASGMRDAIAGMLTMSRMGEGDGPPGTLFSSDSQGSRSQASAAEEEEQLMADCYRDGEFVYPSFDLSEDEEDAIQKAKKKSERDDNWNPKARVDTSGMKGFREHRVGVQKAAVASTLASTAAKLTENPPAEKKHLKKLQKAKLPEKKEFEVEPLPGPSSALDDEGPVNAFRPGIKRPVDPCAGAALVSKPKKPKKGQATVKQRLGKLLKIKKMVY
ncbi:lysine-specific demethylase 7A [Aplysia californica]|uniref:Lysine-specific demethylase 7A n=1 Tax=Aplysia californica TaxID=6500 RepID=A0ABM1A5G4_APLCA|nr:lysine-specific demethylase 7A [Aplysia californica]